jgi:hypothetical protein
VKVVVSGTRDAELDWADAGGRTIWEILNELHASNRITRLSEGGARGADFIAHEWARIHGIHNDCYPVDHMLDGPWPAAGVRRNVRMLGAAKPDLLIAFPGPASKGTHHCIRAAERIGIVVSEHAIESPRRRVRSSFSVQPEESAETPSPEASNPETCGRNRS